MIDPLRIEFVVDCSARHAFEVWTARIGLWWPDDHSVSGAPERVVMEPRVGGRIYERDPGGVEHHWGEVTGWEPPGLLRYRWHLGREATAATDVEIRFVEDDARTRVEILHTGWERLGADAPTWRERNLGGWTTLVPHFRAAARVAP